MINGSVKFCFCHYIVLTIFIFPITLASWKRNSITLENGGYKNILIAIQNSEEEEDLVLIDRLKEIFTKGSSFLFEATNRRVYFKTISILVPASWPVRDEYEVAGTETYENANILVEGDDEGPFVRNIIGCGKQGEQMYLSPKYVRDREYAEIWGPVGRTIVHEWGHLRWGVFDEYPYDGETKFFIDNRRIEATRCSKSVNGKYEDNGRKCKKDPKTGVYTASCKFRDDGITQSSRTSIMYKQFLSSVNMFCSRNDIIDGHYEKAPNRHNKHCDRQGTWDVIMKTDDFKGGNNSPLNYDMDVTPVFRIVQSRSSIRVVLVLDTSGSMEGDPLHKLRQAMIQYIGSTVPFSSYVGIVTFSSDAIQKAPLTLLNDESDRDYLKSVLPTDADGRTSIGSGVLKGIELLSADLASSPIGGYLLVVSDGENTDYPDIEDVLDGVINSGVIVDTIAFTDNADVTLQKLSDVSGGTTYFDPSESDSISELSNSLSATINDRSSQTNQSSPIQLYNEALDISGNMDNISRSAYIDNSVGIDTLFRFTWLRNSIEVFLQSPDGNLFNQSSKEYNINSLDNIITISINGKAKSGYWNFVISKSSNSDVVVTVTVESKQSSEDDVPVTVSSFVSEPLIDYRNDQYIKVFVYAFKGKESITNANVYATLTKPGAPNDVIKLYDTGTNADIEKHDGVYSAYFFNFTGSGRYGVEVKVSGTDKTVLLGKGSKSLPIREVEEEPSIVPVDMFERSVSGGSLQVSNYVDSKIDFLEPSRIIDLTNAGVSYEQQSVTLQWTAVGDDFDKGTVSEYDIRFAETFQEISRQFSNATRVTSYDVIKGDLLNIRPAGELEEIIVRLPKRGDVEYYFGVMAFDDANNTGGISNIISANLEYIPPLESESEESNVVTWVVIGVVAILLLMFIIMIVGLLTTRRRRKRNKPRSDIDMGHVNPNFA